MRPTGRGRFFASSGRSGSRLLGSRVIAADATTCRSALRGDALSNRETATVLG